jgi:LacI family transcriptional regulator
MLWLVSRDSDEPASIRRRASRADVAARAGVSHGTVSHVLNHPDRVRPETRARVEAAIAELGFVRDEAARHLRAGYSTTIGLLLLDAWNPGFTEIARGVEDRTGESWTVLMSNSARDTARETRYLREYAARRVAGLIVIPNDDATQPLHELWHADIPLVLVDRAGDGPSTLSVSVDDRVGGALAADHLLALGHRRIAFAGDPGAALPVQARFAGFTERVAGSGTGAEVEVLPVPLTIDAGLALGRELAARPAAGRPTAVATAVDLIAIGVLHSLLSAGVGVPDEVSLVGYDDIPFTAQLSVPLTSVARPHQEMGRTAAELLLRTVEGHQPTERHPVLAPALVVRGSTAPPRPES